jgi:hypothetical protein
MPRASACLTELAITRFPEKSRAAAVQREMPDRRESTQSTMHGERLQ